MIYKTNREYQSAYAEFMVLLRECEIISFSGKKVKKLEFFDAIYKDHSELYSAPFILNKNIQFLLLVSGHNKDFTLRRRDDITDYNEDEEYKEKSRQVFTRKAGAMVRKIKTRDVSTMELLKILINAIEYTFQNHDKIDAEIERSFT